MPPIPRRPALHQPYKCATGLVELNHVVEDVVPQMRLRGTRGVLCHVRPRGANIPNRRSIQVAPTGNAPHTISRGRGAQADDNGHLLRRRGMRVDVDTSNGELAAVARQRVTTKIRPCSTAPLRRRPRCRICEAAADDHGDACNAGRAPEPRANDAVEDLVREDGLAPRLAMDLLEKENMADGSKPLDLCECPGGARPL